MQTRLAVVIPALNEEETLSKVLNNILLRGHTPILVDDGSTDKTVAIAENTLGVIVIKHPHNLGYEPALSSGVHKAAELGFELVATFDADDQLDASDLDRFISILDKEKSDLVVGVRDYRNRYSEYVLALFGKLRFGLTDPLCGLKLYRLNQAKKFFPFDSEKLIGMELAMKMLYANHPFSQTSIKVKKRIGESRYGTSLQGEINIMKSLLKVIKKFHLKKNDAYAEK